MIKIRLAVMNDDACWKPFAYDYTDHILNAEFYAVYVDLELPMSCYTDEKLISKMFDEISDNDLEYFINRCDNHIRLEVDKEDRLEATAKDHLYELHDDMYDEFGCILLNNSEDFFYTRIVNLDTELMRP